MVGPLRIAQVAPLYERVPPLRYGGTERVVSYLTEGLVERGHDVTLFASGDSLTRAELVPGAPARAGRIRSHRSPPRHAAPGLRPRLRVRRDPLPHRLPRTPACPRQP